MANLTIQQAGAIREVLDALEATVQSAGKEGAPAGPMYASLSTQGCTIEQFSQLMGILISQGKIEQRGHVYYASKTELSNEQAQKFHEMGVLPADAKGVE